MILYRIMLSTLLLGSITASAQTGAESASLPPDLVGVWKLLSIKDVRSDGKPGYDIDLGPNVTGYLIVDKNGIACIQGMKQDRPKWTEAPEKAEATDAEVLSYGRGFFGYCVTGVQARRNALTGVVQISNDPNEVGQTWSRPFSLQGDQLFLTPAFDEAGVHIQRRATFARVIPEEQQRSHIPSASHSDEHRKLK